MTQIPSIEDVSDAHRPYGLTARELEVTLFVVRGFTNKEIGRKLWLTEQTIKYHVAHSLAKVGVTNRHGLIAKWIREQEMPAALAGFVQHLFDVVDPDAAAPPSEELLAAAVEYVSRQAVAAG
jgi:DNA-binding CsgD family transcriptional regulator